MISNSVCTLFACCSPVLSWYAVHIYLLADICTSKTLFCLSECVPTERLCVEDIGEKAFYGCAALKSARRVIPVHVGEGGD